MTLVIACLTPEHVLLAADTRLTGPDSELVDDDAMKMALWSNQFAVAYTGLANLRPRPRGRTDLWIADQLAGPPNRLPDLLARMATNATQVFGQIVPKRRLGEKCHAFVFSGWQWRTPQETPTPFVTTVSNAFEADGGWRRWPFREFQVAHPLSAPTEPFRVYSAGQPAQQEIAELEAAFASGRENPTVIMTRLVETIRSVSARNRTVGERVLVTILPRAAVGRPPALRIEGQDPGSGPEVSVHGPGRISVGAAGPSPTSRYFLPGSDTGTIYAPHVVTPEGQVTDARLLPGKSFTAEEFQELFREEAERAKREGQ
jgi:hypothetical protein